MTTVRITRGHSEVVALRDGEGLTLVLPDGRRCRIQACKGNGRRARLAVDAPADVTVSAPRRQPPEAA